MPSPLPKRKPRGTRPPKPKHASELTGKQLIHEPGRGLVPAPKYGALDEPYNAYLEELAPRDNDKFKQALAGSQDQRFTTFLARLYDGKFRNWKLATIAKHCGLALPEIADFWMSAQKMQAIARAQTAAGQVIDDMAKDARTKQLTCPRCDGFGTVLNDRAAKDNEVRCCPDCGGEGRVSQPGDTDSRKLLLEVAGMAGKKGPSVQINNNNFGGASIESAVGRLGKVSFELEDLNDGEVIDVTSTP